jgi:hypothetical protein
MRLQLAGSSWQAQRGVSRQRYPSGVRQIRLNSTASDF